MAQVSISITRENGTQMNASATVEDADVAGIAATLAALVIAGADAPVRPRKTAAQRLAEKAAQEAALTAPAPTVDPALGEDAPPAPVVAPVVTPLA